MDHMVWTRSIVVAIAIVVAALIPVMAKDDKPQKVASAQVAQVVAAKPRFSGDLSGNRKVCLSLQGLPVSVLERRYREIYHDHNESGDTAIPMNGGECWIKWFYPDKDTERGGYAQRVKFYND